MPHHDDMTEGFRELLDTCGVQLQWEYVFFRAILGTQSPVAAPYALTPGDDQTVRVSALANDFAMAAPVVGDYFEDPQGCRYRIKFSVRRPGQPIIRFNCEISQR